MHVRLSSIIGTPIIDDQSQQLVGVLADPLIHPDTGKIEGFFVHALLPELPPEVFLQSIDIIAWGTHVHMNRVDRLCPPDELIRLKSLLMDPRPFLGQYVRLEGSERLLGVCSDIQFDTRHFTIEWIFPRKFFVYRQPVAVGDIHEVTKEAIWVRDPIRSIHEKVVKETEAEKSPILPTESLPVSARIL